MLDRVLASFLPAACGLRRIVHQPQTVQTHLGDILTKLGVHSKLEAVVFGLRHGVVSA
jgi:DNA-binding NarL/FixJ family response regulator